MLKYKNEMDTRLSVTKLSVATKLFELTVFFLYFEIKGKLVTVGKRFLKLTFLLKTPTSWCCLAIFSSSSFFFLTVSLSCLASSNDEMK